MAAERFEHRALLKAITKHRLCYLGARGGVATSRSGGGDSVGRLDLVAAGSVAFAHPASIDVLSEVNAFVEDRCLAAQRRPFDRSNTYLLVDAEQKQATTSSSPGEASGGGYRRANFEAYLAREPTMAMAYGASVAANFRAGAVLAVKKAARAMHTVLQVRKSTKKRKKQQQQQPPQHDKAVMLLL